MNHLLEKISVFTVVAVAVFCMIPMQADSRDFEDSKRLLCATTKVIECLDNGNCDEVALEEINMPRFFITDFENNELRPVRPDGVNKTSRIERQELVDGKRILQGAEDGLEGVRDGIGWTLAISGISGEFTLTASGDRVAFVVFGACTPPE